MLSVLRLSTGGGSLRLLSMLWLPAGGRPLCLLHMLRRSAGGGPLRLLRWFAGSRPLRLLRMLRRLAGSGPLRLGVLRCLARGGSLWLGMFRFGFALLFVPLLLPCEGRNSDSEKQRQNSGAGDSTCFHTNYLSYCRVKMR